MRRADADVKGLDLDGHGTLSKKARQAAYACACSLVMTSQTKEHFFRTLLEKPGEALLGHCSAATPIDRPGVVPDCTGVDVAQTLMCIMDQ